MTCLPSIRLRNQSLSSQMRSKMQPLEGLSFLILSWDQELRSLLLSVPDESATAWS